MIKLHPIALAARLSVLSRILAAQLPVAALLALHAGPAAATNYLCSWNSATASWNTAVDWASCNNTSPNDGSGNTYDATIAAPGSYTITLSAPVTIGTLTLNDTSATLQNSSTLTTTGGVVMQAGTLNGGTYAVTGGTSAMSLAGSGYSGTLNGVTLNGSLDITGNSAAVYFNGLTVNNTAGSGPGVINVTGSSASLYSTATQTLDGATVHLGGTSGPGYLYSASGTLTLGSNLHVMADGSGSYAQIYGGTIVNNGGMAFSNGSANNYINPNTFTNNGAITVAGGTTLYAVGGAFTNGTAGTITGADGSSVYLNATSFSNAGTVTMNGTGGATALWVGYQSNPGANSTYEWTNTGSINVTDTALNLGGYFTQADIGTINRTGGTVSLLGYLDNSSATLNIQTGALAGMTMAGGTIHGGTIQGGSSNLFTANSSSGTLDGVTLNGSLDITGNSATAYFSNGLTVKNTAGTGPGVINVTGSSAYLYSTGTQTLDNATVHLGGTSGPAYLYSASGTLTLGSNLHVLADGSSSSYGYLYGTTIINNGSIAFSNGSANNYITPSAFTNNGAISVAGGTTLYAGATTFTNSSSGTITGADGSSVYLTANSLTNAGTVTMNGTGGATALWVGYQSNPGANTTYEWTNTGTINVTDTALNLGGYFTQADIGTINRTGGTVSLLGYLDNSSATLNIQTGPLAVLTMAGGTIHGGTIQGGSSNLFTANSSTGTLDGVTLNGSLDITGNSATAYFSNGLTVNNTAGTGPGVINVTGSSAYLFSTTAQTLDNATVHLGGTSGPGYLYSQTGTLTLGSNLHVLADGSASSYADFYCGSFINNGSIAFSNGSANNYITPSAFTNNGAISVAGGTTLYAGATTFMNSSSGTITGADGSSVYLNATSLTNAGTVTMNGTGGATALWIGYQGNPGANTTYEWTNTGSINVTDTALNLGGYFTQADIGTINRTGGTVSLLGYLNNSSATLNVQTGALAGLSMNGGTIHGGTIQGGSSNLFTANSSSGTLDGVTLNGSLDITGNSATAYFSNGLTVKNTAGTGPGVINVTGSSAYLYSTGTQTLDNATVHLGGTSGPGYIYSQTGTLTLGSNLQVLADGSSGSYGYIYGGTVVNNGNIAFSNGSANYISPTTFTNNGAITVAGGTTLYANGPTFTNGTAGTITGADSSSVYLNATSFSNAGTVTMNGAGGATALWVGYQSNPGANTTYEWTNTGSINVTDTALNLGGYFTQADIGTINRTGGTVSLLGYLNNSSATLNIQTGALAGLSMAGGTIHGGTIQGGSSNLFTANSSSGTLDGVTLNGSLDITGNSATAYFSNGLTVNNTAGTSPGVINVTGSSAYLYSTGTQTLDNATVHLGGTSGPGFIYSQTGTLTLGSNLQVLADGSSGSYGYIYGSNIVNNGSIAFSNGSASNYLTPNTLTNNGVVSVSNGSTLYMQPTTLTNFSGGTLTGGSYQAIGGSTIYLSQNTEITNLAADVVLSGAGSVIQSYDTSSNTYKSIDSTLTTIQSSGALHILAARDYTTGNAITNHGMLQLGGGTFTAPSLTNSGTVTGFGTIVPVVANTGSVVATGGNLTLAAGVTGTSGTVQIAGDGLLTLGASSTAGTLIHDGSAAGSLNLGSNNITVSSDYQNANFGVGNSFNNHANVTGSGQILAAGNVGISVSGSAITGGNTPTPTLAFGNVHVGSNINGTFDVNNTGTSGPVIRGAIQTTGITTAGLGITAQNYGPLGLGGSSAITYSFAPIAGGSLAGQNFNVVTNFDNVAGKTVSVSGAAYNLAAASVTPAPVIIANQRIGGTNSQNLTVSNTAPSGSFTEGLDVTFGSNLGSATNNGGTINLLAGQASNSSAMSVALNTSAAGAITGGVALNYVSDGAGTSGLGTTSLGGKKIAVTGNVYQLAAGTLNSSPLNFGTVQVGQSVSQILSITNSASGPAGFVEDLNASFGAASGTGSNLISGAGQINGLTAGSTNNSGMTVSVNTSSAGTVSGNIAVNFVSAGAVGGVNNGLGTLAIGSTSYGVSGTIATTGNVVNQAAPIINNSPINLGNVRVGAASPTGTVSITNQATTAPQAALNASISGNGFITASGSFNQLDPGATDSSSLQVGMNTGSAGNKSGTATISLVSDASNIGGCAPNCQLTLASQNVSVTGAVYNAAIGSASPSPSVNLGSVRIGGTLAQALTVTNTQVAGAYSEDLNAGFGSSTGAASGTGSITGLLAGSSNGSAMNAGLDATSAGVKSGTVSLNYVTAGTVGGASDGLGTASVGNQLITLTGKVYQQAVALVNTLGVNFGIVHVGDNVTAQNISVSNNAPIAGLNDVLKGSISTAGPFTAGGTLGAGLAAGASNAAGTLTAGLNTSVAGAYNGNATLTFLSSNPDMADLALASQNVALTGQVDNYAVADMLKTGGAGSLTRNGNTITLDFGTLTQGTGTIDTSLEVLNNVTGLSDLLGGSFTLNGANDFGLSGFNAFSGLAAGGTETGLGVSFGTSNLGQFNDQIALDASGSNGSGYSDAQDINLVLKADVVASSGNVPEPGTLALLAIAAGALYATRRRSMLR